MRKYNPIQVRKTRVHLPYQLWRYSCVSRNLIRKVVLVYQHDFTLVDLADEFGGGFHND